MVIELLNVWCKFYKCLFFALFVSFKHAFHVDAEIMIARTRKNVNKYLQIYFHRDRFVDIYKDRFTVVALSSVGHAVFLSFILRDSHYLQMTENKTKYHRKQKKKNK